MATKLYTTSDVNAKLELGELWPRVGRVLPRSHGVTLQPSAACGRPSQHAFPQARRGTSRAAGARAVSPIQLPSSPGAKTTWWCVWPETYKSTPYFLTPPRARNQGNAMAGRRATRAVATSRPRDPTSCECARCATGARGGQSRGRTPHRDGCTGQETKSSRPAPLGSIRKGGRKNGP